ncbi:DUF1523 family protein [Thioclava sp. FR2]|uniref:DUF1523 family protein n=1 Tax=Thioclava sp. FR2 TaxID=3445780 RepID=UPI003EBF4ADE
MRYVKWTLWLIIATLIFGFLHYTLPQHDIVRIVGTENRRIDFGENSIFWASPDAGTAATGNRDVRFINTVLTNGKVMVYRNEDTGWGWPPYFKLDSSNLQTEAQELTSTTEAPKWVAITHYGWRNEFFTIFPNAVGVRQVEGPDVRIIPWVNIILLTIVALILLMIRRMWLQFRERTIDPALDEVSETWEEIDAKADAAREQARGVFGRFGAWLDTWKRKPPRR